MCVHAVCARCVCTNCFYLSWSATTYFFIGLGLGVVTNTACTEGVGQNMTVYCEDGRGLRNYCEDTTHAWVPCGALLSTQLDQRGESTRREIADYRVKTSRHAPYWGRKRRACVTPNLTYERGKKDRENKRDIKYKIRKSTAAVNAHALRASTRLCVVYNTAAAMICCVRMLTVGMDQVLYVLRTHKSFSNMFSRRPTSIQQQVSQSTAAACRLGILSRIKCIKTDSRCTTATDVR